jgi:DNA processing protein
LNEQDTFHKIALSQLFGIGTSRLSKLLNQLSDYQDVFNLTERELWLQTGVNKSIIGSLQRTEALRLAEKQLKFNEKNEIRTSFFLDSDFPRRLRQCPDSPIVLFSKGNFDWNQEKIIAIVGTRHPSEYGRHFLSELLEEFKDDDVLIVSGLAYGIDAQAHTLSLTHNIQTIGVLGHGMDRIYPKHHLSLAREMLNNGGLVTEFMIGTKPDREHFPMRNRIVAGLCDATVVIESKEKGGSIITAELAFDYNRDVFALPGDVQRETSRGCNYLIKKGIANILTSAMDIRKVLNWSTTPTRMQPNIGFELNEVEQLLVDFIDSSPHIHVDVLFLKSGIPFSQLQAILLQLEIKGVISHLPGNRIAKCKKKAS